MENKRYPEWKYKINLEKLHVDCRDGKITWEYYITRFYQIIQHLKKIIHKSDQDLIDQIKEWEEDIFIVEINNGKEEIFCVKNDNDFGEMEFELNSLYDLGDYKKMIWFDQERPKND